MEEKENSIKLILLIIAFYLTIRKLIMILITTTTVTTQKVSDEDEKVKKTIEKFLEIDCVLHTDYILDYLNLGFDESKQIYDGAIKMVITNVK